MEQKEVEARNEQFAKNTTCQGFRRSERSDPGEAGVRLPDGIRGDPEDDYSETDHHITSDKSNTSGPPSNSRYVSWPEGGVVVSSENDTMLITSRGGVKEINVVRLFAKKRNAHA